MHQYSYEHLMNQPYEYELNAPPFIPRLKEVHPLAYDLMPEISAITANAYTASVMTNSPSAIRILTYNMVSDRDWDTQEFAESVWLVASQYAFQCIRNMVSNDIYAITEIANKVVMSYASYLSSGFTEFMRRLPQNTQAAIMHNVEYYHKLHADAESVFRDAAQPPVGHYHQSIHTPRHGPQPARGHGNSAIADFHQSGTNAYTGNRRERREFSKFGTHHQPPMEERRRPEPVKEQYKEPVIEVQRPQPPAGQSYGETQMNRTLHSLVYKNQKFGTIPNYKEDPLTTFKNTVSETEKKVEKAISEKRNPSDLTVSAEYKRIYETTLDEAVLNILSEMSVVSMDELTVTPYQAVITTPIFASKAVDEAFFKGVFDKMSNTKSLASLAEVLADALIASRVDHQASRTNVNLAWIKQIDRYLTKTLNDYFLKTGNNGGFKFSSFIEDGQDIQKYVVGMYSAPPKNYMIWIQSFISNLFKWRTEVILSDYTTPRADDFAGDEEAERAVLDTVATVYNISYVSACYDLFATDIAQTPSTVSKQHYPTLHALLTQLNRLSTASMQATRQIVLMADGVMWSFYEHQEDSNVFIINEV